MSKYPGRVITDLAPAGYSVFFDGTGDFVSRAFTSTTDGMYPQGTTYTVEAWIYPATSSGIIYAVSATNITNFGVLEFYLASGVLTFGVRPTTGGSPTSVSGGAVSTNVWTHVAASVSGGSVRLFVNGALVAGPTSVSALSFTPVGGAIGYLPNGFVGANHFNGYISNVRIVQGVAVYTGAFTPPTQLLNITGTSLLTCNSPALIDQSTNNFTITPSGNVVVSTFTPFTAYVPYNPALGASTPGIWTLDEALQAAATRQWNMYDPAFNLTTLLLHGNPTNAPTWLTDVSTNNYTITPVADARAAGLTPFSTASFPTSGSGYFDGTGDYLQFTSNTNVQFGSGDFTVEAWVYLPSLANTFYAIAGQRTGDSVATVGWSMYINASKASFDIANGTSSFTATNNTTLAVNTWYHIAAVRSGSNLTVYVNGTAGTPVTVSGSVVVVGSLVYVGFLAGSAITPFNGYISNIRIVKGVVVYTGNFTTPTAPLTATQAAGTNIAAITGTQTSLLTLQNSQSANNNAFLDSSSNNFLITRNGNTTQGSFSPFSQAPGYWSNFFDGSSSLTSATGAATALGSGNFCVELWYYRTSTNNVGLFGNLNGPTDLRWAIVAAGGTLRFQGWNTLFLSPTEPSINQWHHVAVSRSGTVLSMFIDGVRAATATNSTNFSDTQDIQVGGPTGVGNFTGYISNARVVKGSAVYDPNQLSITVPTTPLTNITNTTYLTSQSNRFVDNGTANSGSGFAITVNGTPSVQAFSPFYSTAAYTPQTIGGSGYFDGTGDYLTTPSTAVFNVGTGNFTVETWIYPNAITANTLLFISFGTTNGIGVGFQATNAWGLVNSGVAWVLTTSTMPTVGQWNHLVVCRGGTGTNQTAIFLNGTRVTTGTVTTSFSQTSAYGIGWDGSNTVYNGYMSSLRVTNADVYGFSNSTITVPTAPLTAIANTQLLLNFTNAGVVDSTGKNVFETTGNAQITTALSRFGGSSIFFDGTGDALFIPPNQKENLRFGTGDFTIEFWAWKSANGSTNFDGVISVTPDGSFNGGFGVELSSSRGFCFLYDSAVRVQSVINPNDSTWHHYAVVRSGSTFALYRDGVQLTTATLTPTLGIAGNAYIGGVSSATANNFNGYIDELRVTRGFARYTGNFTPQTSQWQDQ